jgi:hypothetical protein
MTPPQAQPVSLERSRADAAARDAASSAEGPFVINLCSSTTPMALSQPRDPSLARFTFFVSRRLEDGRERFRLHMGYFETLPEAEEWLSVVREIYPGAWAGEAPGKRLRARSPETSRPTPPSAPAVERAPQSPPPEAPKAARATQSASERPAPAAPSPAIIELALSEPVAAPEPRAFIPANVPVLQAAPAAASTADAARPASESTPRQPPAKAPGAVKPGRGSAAPKPSVTRGTVAAAPATAAPKAAAKPLQLSNVREVLASLDETGVTREMPALPSPGAAPRAPGPVAKPAAAAAPAQSAPAPRRRAVPAAEQVEITEAPRVHTGEGEQSLSDTQVLKLLEGRRSDGGQAEPDSSISLLKPDDTGTRRALKEAVADNAPVSFAVQLQWSVQPIDAAAVPPLAIFSAYTLYTVEGSREGRRWYGLRLGFFSDAISAKQVAHYVRSEFSSVAVVPVSPHERIRATEGSKSPSNGGKSPSPSSKASPPKPALRDRLPEPTAEFKLIEDEPAPRVPEPPAPAPVAAPRAAPSAPAKRGRTPPGRIRAREKRSPQTLEETLEILGADQLEIDRGRGETLNDTGVRHLSVQVRKNSPFTKLLDRLAERARGK